MTEKHSNAGGDTSALKHAASGHGAEGESAAFKMSSEALNGLAGLNQMRNAPEAQGSDPEVLKMLSGFSLNNDSAANPGANTVSNGFDANICSPQNPQGMSEGMSQGMSQGMSEGPQIGIAAIGSIMSGMADVGKDFAASQDTDSTAGPDDSSADYGAQNPMQPAGNSDTSNGSSDESEPDFPPAWMKRIFENQNAR